MGHEDQKKSPSWHTESKGRKHHKHMLCCKQKMLSMLYILYTL